mmetsp:Transcript_2744/g.4140  ORF Transcript_2744/g.4140 Transcript_2744/m.4140 type:complete len:283 (+) Transcript_2744:256-1104(+)
MRPLNSHGRTRRWTHPHQIALVPHLLFDILEKVLLRTDYHAGPTNSHPCNHFPSLKLVVFHDICPNAGSCPPKSCFTVHRKSLISGNCFKCFYDPLEDGHSGTRTIKVILFEMFNTSSAKVVLVVHSLIKTNYETNLFAVEVRNIILRCEGVATFPRHISLKLRTRKGKDFILDDPIEVTILYLLKELIFLDVEIVKDEEFVCTCFGKSPQTIQDVQVVCTLAGTSIVEWWYGRQRGGGRNHRARRIPLPRLNKISGKDCILKWRACLFWRMSHVQDLPCAH